MTPSPCAVGGWGRWAAGWVGRGGVGGGKRRPAARELGDVGRLVHVRLGVRGGGQSGGRQGIAADGERTVHYA